MKMQQGWGRANLAWDHPECLPLRWVDIRSLLYGAT